MKKQIGLLLSLLSGAVAAANPPTLTELDKTIADNSVGFGSGTRYYRALYLEPESDAACAAIVSNNLAAQVARLALAPEKASYRLSYASTLLFLERYEAALKEYEAALRLEKDLDSYARGQVRFERAECLYALGDEKGCAAALDEILSSRLDTVRRWCPNWKQLAGYARMYLRGPNLDGCRLPRDTGAKPYPRPQEAVYEEVFTLLAGVRLDLKGVAEGDARIGLLKTKLARRGITAKTDEGAFVLAISLDATAAVDRPEGYMLTIGETGAEICARDRQGVLWGVVSFIQCLDPAKPAVRRCRVRDWPDAARRGYLCAPNEHHLEFMLFNKFNSLDFQDDAWCAFSRFSPLEKMMAERMAKEFADFGLELYFGIASSTMWPKLPLSAPRTFARQVEVCRFYAACGAGVYFPFDDDRFPLPKGDLEKFGAAANIDAKHVTRVFRAVKKDFPAFKMIFCPPFYWGPDSGASYPEAREPYLKSLKDFLDPEIDVYWTGPMVKGYDKTPAQVKWFTDLTGRKPTIFQNGTGAHNLLNYGVDPTPWNVWHDDDFVNTIACFHQNTGPLNTQIATLGDWLWHVKDYDPTDSVRRAVGQFAGTGVYEALAPALPALAYFDKYRWGELTVDILGEKIPDLEAKLARATNAWAKACALSDLTPVFLNGFGSGCGYATRVVRQARNPPDVFARYADEAVKTQAYAAEEVGYDKTRGDILLTIVDLFGGQTIDNFKQVPPEKKSRYAKCLRSAGTSFHELKGSFTCDPFPPSAPYELVLMGCDDERATDNVLEVTVNGKSVWKGPSRMRYEDFNVKRIPLPFDCLVRNNTFTIRNLTPGTNSNGTPWFAINYLVIRKGEVRK